ncbi:MAG TPA: Gfo/Idh/MocA family oxidoreductase [Chryseolinea sp.]
MNRRNFISSVVTTGSLLGFSVPGLASSLSAPIKIGIIGLDTSHSPAFAKYFNLTDSTGRFRVVAAYPHGSKDIQSSVSRIPKYTEEVITYGVTVVESITKLLEMADVVLLETNDGRLHKEQAFQVLDANKPLFIDKPIAASLEDVLAIYKRAGERGVPLFSASSLRYMKTAQAARYNNAIGKVLGADTFSPATLEPHHPDLFWYGIHGVEILFTVMGPGCESVSRFNRENMDVVVGMWADGRIGTFRGTREGKHDYGGTAFGSTGNMVLGPFDGYDGLAVKIAEFFATRKSPIDDIETLEIYAFMEAADVSKKKGGTSVKLSDVMG